MTSLPDPLHTLTSGRARFTGDLPLPAGTLHAQVAVSPHVHARFSRVDTAAALAENNVVAVLTAADIPGDNQIGNLHDDEPLLAADEVHCVGQPYALVLATTAEAAWRAAQRVSADWQPLPAILELAAAWAAGQLMQPSRTFALGDVEATWAQCTRVVEGEVVLGSAEHVYMETQCALATPRADGSLHLWSATQAPSGVQKAAARVLGLPMHAVEVEVARLGGGFGGKEEQATPWACLAALGAARSGRPVHLWLDRQDDMRLTGKRHPYLGRFRLGLDGDGRFLAYEVLLLQDAGCTTDLSPAILERSLFHATNAYAIPNVRLTAASCRTNLPSNTAFRGFGAPQAIFAIEAAIRRAAQELGVTPESLQQRNLLREGDVLPYGQVATGVRAAACWGRLVERCDLPARQRQVAAWNAAQPLLRRGLAVIPLCFGIAFTKTLLNQAEALVHVYGDGSVGLTTGAVEMGQGVQRKLRRVVALTLGIAEERVRLESTATTRVANLSPTAASTGADLNGGAAREACRRILAGLRPLAAELLGVPDSALQFAGGRVCAGDAAITWEGLVAAAHVRRLPLSALAHYATPGLHFDDLANRGSPFAYHVYGAALVEATVDVLRGTGRVDHVSVVHDIGMSLDETVDRGQVEGAIVQGLGWMTSEEIRHDPAGRLLTDTLATYKIPDLDSAPTIDLEWLIGDNPAAVLNSKAVGEPPLIYGLGAYFALQAAIASWRPAAAAVFRAPLSAEHIFALLHGDSP